MPASLDRDGCWGTGSQASPVEETQSPDPSRPATATAPRDVVCTAPMGVETCAPSTRRHVAPALSETQMRPNPRSPVAPTATILSPRAATSLTWLFVRASLATRVHVWPPDEVQMIPRYP